MQAGLGIPTRSLPGRRRTLNLKSSGLIVKVGLILSWYSGSASSMLKRWRISAQAVIISCSAIALPGQALAPVPKAFHAFGGFFSHPPSRKRSGRNSSASTP